MPKQLEMAFRTWGGARRGAGRKPNGGRAGVSHLRRAPVDARHPVLVTSRVRDGVPSLRSDRAMREVRRAFAAAKQRFGFRLIHFSVQGNHLHLIVEAADRRALARGMKGLAVRVARGVNRGFGRVGAVFADRYHARSLKTPREVRNSLAYVLLNRQRHAGGGRVSFPGCNVDPCSSGAAFDGWARGFEAAGDPSAGELVARARSWLLVRGWRRHRRIDPGEIPGPKMVT